MRALLWAGTFVFAAAVTLGLGLALLVAPGWAGDFLSTFFAIFPRPASKRMRMAYRALGALLAAFGATYGAETVRAALRMLLGSS